MGRITAKVRPQRLSEVRIRVKLMMTRIKGTIDIYYVMCRPGIMITIDTNIAHISKSIHTPYSRTYECSTIH